MSISLEQTNGMLPEMIGATLRRLIRRARWVMFLRGICGVAAVATICVLLVMAVDVTVTFIPSWPRWALTCWALAVTLVAAVVFLVRPLAHSFTLAGIARAVESNHPELQERISSAVELLASKDAPEVRGSNALIGALVAEATQDIRLLQPRHEVTLRGAKPFLLAAGLALAVLAGLLLGWPATTARLLQRALAPFMNLPNVAANELTVTPGDAVIKPGESLRVEVLTTNRAVRGAHVHLLARGGTTTVRPMLSLSESEDDQLHFSAALPPAGQDFQYRVRASDALTRYYHVIVSPPPSVTGMDIRYDYPKYTGREPLVQQNAAGDVSAVVGTRVTVTAHVDKPVVSAELFLGDADEAGIAGERSAADDGAACSFSFELTTGLKGYWHMTLSDQYAFMNARRDYAVEAVPDLAPSVLIAHPRSKETHLKPTDSLPVIYAVEDDLGLGAVELLLKKDGQDVQPLVIPLTPDEQGLSLSTIGQAAVDLASPALQGAGKVEFRLRARDLLPPELSGPHETMSESYTIVVDKEAPDYADQLRAFLQDDIRAGLELALKELKTAKTGSAQLRTDVPKADALTERMLETLSDVSQHLSAADEAARDVAQMVLGTPFSPMEEKLASVSNEDIAKAQNAAAQVSLTDDKQQRTALSEEADTRIESAIDKVSDLLKQFEAMAEALRQMEALHDLATREDALADEKAQAPTPDTAWQQAQQGLVGDLSDFMRQTPEALQAQVAADTKRLEDLAERARKLQEEQKDLAADTKAVNDLAASNKRLQDLAQAQEKLAERAGADQLSADEKAGMTAAAENIRSDQLSPAVEKQQAAENALTNEAAALRQQEAAADLAAQAAQLAREQRDLANQVAQAKQAVEAGRAQAESPRGQTAAAAHDAAVAQQQLAGLALRQPQLQTQAEKLSEYGATVSPQARDAFRQNNPAPAMQESAAALGRQDTPKAADASRSAAETAEALAQALRDQAQKAPPAERRTERATQMATLARDQSELREQVQDLLQQRRQLQQQLQNDEVAALPNDQMAQAMAPRQQELREETTELGQETGAVQGRLSQLFPQTPASAAAAQATQFLDQAVGAEQQAHQALTSGSPAQALPPQAASAEALGRAADALQRAGQLYAQAAAALQLPEAMAENAEAGQHVSQAFEEANVAAQTQQSAPAAMAAQDLHAAERMVASRAQQMGLTPFSMQQYLASRAAYNQFNPNSSQAVRQPTTRNDFVALKQAGLTLSDWAKLPSELRNDILQAAGDSSPAEYRLLIKRYFQDIARRGASSSEAQP